MDLQTKKKKEKRINNINNLFVGWFAYVGTVIVP